MNDDDNQLTILPLSRVPPTEVESERITKSDSIVSTVEPQGARIAGVLPMMVEVLPVPVLVIDDRYRLVVANAEARRLLAQENVRFIGYSAGRFLSMEKLQEARQVLLSRAGSVSYRDSILAGGVERDVELRIELLDSGGEEFLCAAVIDQTDWDRERAEWTESRDTAAPPSTRIDHAHRLEALGHLTGSLAHDFNNLLSVILASLEAARRRVLAGQDPATDIQRAMTATRRSIESTTEILRYSRSRTARVEAVSPVTLLSELKGLIERAVGAAIELAFELNPTGDVCVGAAQLETAVLNLIINARDAVEGGGRIRVRLDREVLDEDTALSLGLLPGAHARILVEDSGEGMTDDVKARVFEPFFTTKPEGRGTGLGLSTVRSVAQKFGGAVILDSVVGRGTEVRLYFPEVS